ncbi:hypothetical protein [Yersinia massiliensis]|uniref:hypothetical protein n=1 Tax=Yersinia massiliensis TaxID=419257 RepID=UPI0002F41A19|nr:hypothetical protein [Yersinia massiliensis]QKJ09340.1 hypothetical protein HRD68_00565 [Yersinia massiliensis]
MLTELTDLGMRMTRQNIVADKLLRNEHWRETFVELSVRGRKDGIQFYYPVDKPDIDVVDLLLFYDFSQEQVRIFMHHVISVPGHTIRYFQDKTKSSHLFHYDDSLACIVLN